MNCSVYKDQNDDGTVCSELHSIVFWITNLPLKLSSASTLIFGLMLWTLWSNLWCPFTLASGYHWALYFISLQFWDHLCCTGDWNVSLTTRTEHIFLILNCIRITKTYLYDFDPFKPHSYIAKLGFTGVYIIFLISAQKQRLWVLVRTALPRRF